MSSTLNPVSLPPESLIFGSSPAMLSIRDQLDRFTSSDMPVLIHGASGTGKEVIARLIHSRSSWSAGPFIKVSCPAISVPLFESELFGYEPNASAGAPDAQPGGMAPRGTLLLDEIGELEASLQAKLLQLLQDGPLCRVGAQGHPPVVARLICATHCNLLEEIVAGNFRQDLFYRINALSLSLPALRERREDIPELAAYFIELYNKQFNCRAGPVSAHLMELMQDHPWPGNLRELENLIRRYVILGSEEPIASELLSSKPIPALAASLRLDGSVSLREITRQATRDIERQVILRSLHAFNWNRKRVAHALQISYRALLYKIQDAGIASKRALRKQPGAALANAAETGPASSSLNRPARTA